MVGVRVRAIVLHGLSQTWLITPAPNLTASDVLRVIMLLKRKADLYPGSLTTPTICSSTGLRLDPVHMNAYNVQKIIYAQFSLP